MYAESLMDREEEEEEESEKARGMAGVILRNSRAESKNLLRLLSRREN